VALQPVDGGTSGQGARTIISQRPDILYVSPTVVQDAVTVTVRDTIYGIVFEFTRSVASWEGGAVEAAATFFATNIQALAGYQHVVGIGYTQDASASGNLIDQLVVYVGSDDGTQETSFVWPLEQVDSQGVYAKVDATFATLMQVATST
jgi:hypothetical protein